MVSLSKFRVDSQAVEAGEWVFPDREVYDDLEIKTKGFSDSYTDARSAKMRRAAKPYDNDVARVPNAIARNILIECLTRYVILDVRGIVDEKGEPITIQQFGELLKNPDYAELVTACIKAAAIVGISKQEDKEDATKN